MIIGNITNPTKITPSIAKSKTKRIRSIIIKNVFITIPTARENPTKPCRYSFLRGLKNVWKNKGREKSSKNALFTDEKNPSKFQGASINQNLRKINGSKK